jgi:hypothetical protein
MPLPALARFASEAVDGVLAIARTETDGEKVATALATLQKMVCLNVLPPGKFVSVVDAARARLLDSQTPRTWQAAIELAVSTGDAELRLMVAGIASGLVQPSFPERADLRLWARGLAKRALRRYFESHGVPTPGQPDDGCDRDCDDRAG